jgi:hypothetical protein
MSGLIKRWCLVLVLVSASAVSAQQSSYVPRVHPNDPHRFVVNGSTWHLAGYTPGLSLLIDQANPLASRYYSLMDKMAFYGINSFRSWFTAGQPFGNTTVPYQRTGPGLAADGRPRFDLTKFNQAHFDYFRQVVEYARARGIVIQLSLFDFWHGSAWIAASNGDPQLEWGLKHDFYAAGNNINGLEVTNQHQWLNTNLPVFQYQKALVSKAIDSLGDLPNIIWEVANEAFPETVGFPWQIALANYITSYEQSKGFTPHLVMPRDIPNHENTPGYYLDPDVGATHSAMKSAHSGNRPLVANNDSDYEAYTPDYRRRMAWAILTAGGHLDFFHFAMFKQVNLDSQDVTDGMRYVGYTRKFLDDLDVNLAGMFPSDHLVTNGWCYARNGDEYIIYLASGGSTTVANVPASHTATWFNPRNGMQQAAAGGPTFTAPDGNDWALHIRTSIPGPPPGTSPGPFTLTASPASVSPGGTVTVSWSGIANPKVIDWIGRYALSADDTLYSDWKHTSSCSQGFENTAKAAGSCTFTMPTAPGSYQFRLFSGHTYTRLAASGPVIVQ